MTTELYIDLIIYAIYVLLAATLGLAVWSVARSLRLRRGQGSMVHGIPAGRIAWCVAAGLVMTLVLTFAFAGTEPLMSNGRPFADVLWLRLSDMFIVSSAVLSAVAVAAVLLGFLVRK